MDKQRYSSLHLWLGVLMAAAGDALLVAVGWKNLTAVRPNLEVIAIDVAFLVAGGFLGVLGLVALKVMAREKGPEESVVGLKVFSSINVILVVLYLVMLSGRWMTGAALEVILEGLLMGFVYGFYGLLSLGLVFQTRP